MELILYAIPLFFLLILLEFGYGLARGRNTYRLNDTINSLSLGSLSRLQSLVMLGISAAIYELIATRLPLMQLPADALWVWVVCFVLYDFVYYWKHRLGHEVAIFWGAHVAHHQSEDFNLGTALRQTSMDFYGVLFYLPFFLLGFPAEVLFAVVSLNLIYQFWVHTEHVPKLGPVEWIFVTPSNHRVHHARNSIYVDRNYGGVFILWDRLFGTFQDELATEPVVFGLRKPLQSWNPLWANVHVYWRLLKDSLRTPAWRDKIKVWFMPPAWTPPGIRTSCKLQSQDVDLTSKFDPELPASVSAYVFAQFICSVALSLYLLLNSARFSYAETMTAILLLAYGFYTHGIWLEKRATAARHECIRLGALMILAMLADLPQPVRLSIELVAALSLVITAILVLANRSAAVTADRASAGLR